MPSHSTRRLPGLDTLRASAILLVMIFHVGALLPPVLTPIARIGWMGVDLFFVLSGYLIGLQLLRPYLTGEAPLWRDFYRRRALRILPAYLVVVLLYFLWPAWREQPGISPCWQFLTFTENLFVSYADHKAFSHVWSLCIEEHFYLVLPLLIYACMRRPSLQRTIALFATFVALGLALRFYALVHFLQAKPMTDDDWYVVYYEHIYYPTWARLDGLLAGVALASIQTFRPTWWSRLTAHGLLSLGGFAALFALAVSLFRDRNLSDTGLAAWGTVVGFPLLSIAFALLVVSAVSSNGPLSRTRTPGARLLATLAFTLYLTHKEAVHLARLSLPTLTADPDIKALLTYCAGSLTAAALLHLCVERPFLLLRKSAPAGDEELQADPAL